MTPTNTTYVGVDLGGTNIQAGILDDDGKLLASDKIKTKAENGPEAVIDRIAKLADDLIKQAGVSREQVGGLGIEAPGAVDYKQGLVLNAVNLRWNHVPLGQHLQDRLGIPVVVDNDVNVGTWGEYKAGAGRGHEELMGIFVGTGIGGAFILHGRLYHGSLMTAGEIGHTVLRADAPLGQRTLENLASRTSITNQLKQLIDSNQPSCIPSLVNGNLSKVRSKVLAQAYHQEDRLTREVIGHAARYVAIAIANAVTLLSLPCVVVGGGLTEALQDAWIKLIQDNFRKYVFPNQLFECRILPSELGDDAGVIGAALLAKQRLEKD
ncbi:MAG: ROK family protein [Phycisphaeraceae bacterium]